MLLVLRERIGLLGDEMGTKSSMQEGASARFWKVNKNWNDRDLGNGILGWVHNMNKCSAVGMS